MADEHEHEQVDVDPAPADYAPEAPAVDGEASTDRPDWLPEKFFDAETGAPNVEGLAKSYAALEQGRLERAKNAPAEYKLPKSFDGFEGQVPAQQLTALKEMAKAEGYSQRGFDLLAESVFGNPAAGREALKAEFGDELDETLQACAMFANTLGDHQEAVAGLCSSPAGVKLLNSWRMASADKPLPGAADKSAGGKKTEAELQAMMRDPKYWKDRDAGFIAAVTRGFQELYGGAKVRTAAMNPGE